MNSNIETPQQQPAPTAVASKDGLGQRLTAVGQRVTMSALALERGLHLYKTRTSRERPRTGVVLTETNRGRTLYIRLDGHKGMKPYAAEFWELA